MNKIFEYKIRSELRPFFSGSSLTVYDDPEGEGCAVFTVRGIFDTPEKVKLNREDIAAIYAAMDDDLLFDTDELESDRKLLVLDGDVQYFFFASKGRVNEFHDANLECCRGDENCPHAARVIQALEEIRDILVLKGVPAKCFALETE